MKYEYIVITLRAYPEPLQKLNDLGRYGGWELVTIVDSQAYFKRPLTLLDKLQSK